MKKLKLILPMLAFIMAIGMSFAFVKADILPVQGFIETSPGNWEEVDINCPNGGNDCEVYFSSDPNMTYKVHDTPNGTILKTSNEEAVELP